MAWGLSWASACAALGLTWTLAAAWRARSGPVRTFLRCVGGGLLAVAVASGLYELLAMGGADLRWEALAIPGWSGVGAALRIGIVEESAKLAGISFALRSRAPRPVARATVAVAALFAIAETFVTAEGGPWPLALGRALLAPVAHASLAIPLAWAIARPFASPSLARRHAVDLARLAGALATAALLHGIGDWSLPHAGWGRAAFAWTMIVPVVGLYWWSERQGAAPGGPGSVRVRVRSSSATPQACAMHPRGV